MMFITYHISIHYTIYDILSYIILLYHNSIIDYNTYDNEIMTYGMIAILYIIKFIIYYTL